MNDYQKLRNNLKACYTKQCCMCQGKNVMTCAQKIVRKWVDGDRDKLLELKAQAKDSDINTQIGSIASVSNMATSIFAIYFAIVLGVWQEPSEASGILIVLLLLLIMIFLVTMGVNHWLRKLRIWNEYINVAIDEAESELKK